MRNPTELDWGRLAELEERVKFSERLPPWADQRQGAGSDRA